MQKLELGGKCWGTSFLMLLAFCLALPGIVYISRVEAATALEITRADWNARKSLLNVAGKGTSGAVVAILNADTGEDLGTAAVAKSRRWRIKLKSIDPAPCRIQAVSAGQVQELNVNNAPADCGIIEPPPVILTDLSLNGPETVNENTSAEFIATASFSDGSSRNVNGSARWRVDAGAAATINGGLLTALEVTGDQPVTVSANFTAGEITKDTSIMTTVVDISEPPVEGSHAGRFTVYEGTQTCLTCHESEAIDMHASVHYQWQGDASEAIGLNTSQAGKLGGINDFCIYPDINWIGKLKNADNQLVDGGCAKCHAGLGAKPEPQATRSQLENIDCLVCHSDQYKRTVADMDGQWRFVPDTKKMSVSVLQAAVDIGRPTRDSCLNCHSKSGGGNNYKRGDIEEFHRNPTKDFDVHMASSESGGAGLSCLDCHTAQNHRIAGRGTDLRPRDSAVEVNCTNCHSQRPHSESEIDKHTARVNCTVCHIPVFAKAASTDMVRDWSQPGEFVESRGLYEPSHEKGLNVIPEYRFFNGMSYFYQFGEPADAGENGYVVMSAPIGDINDPGAKIHAFKRHTALQPIDPFTRRLLPLKIGKFFESGEIAEAVRLGANAMDWAYDGHEFQATERYMGLYHEVAPKEQALNCNSCHNGGARLDFAALGYTPGDTYNGKSLCLGCHGDKSDRWSGSEYFVRVHAKHVDGRGYDCSKCHIFSAAR